MKSKHLPRLCSIYLILVGSIVIIGWIFHIPSLVSFYPGGANMVFNTALSFILMGSALFRLTSNNAISVKGNLLLCSVSLTIAMLTLIEYILGLSLGLDHLFIKTWLVDHNPYPGRMSLNTCINFLVASMAFIIMPYAHKKWLGIVLQCCIVFVIFSGLTVLLGYLLKLRFLYSWHHYSSEMAIHTAIGMIALSTGLGAIWLQHPHYQVQNNNTAERKVLLLCYLVLFCAIYISGLAGFAINHKIDSPELYHVIREQLDHTVAILIIVTFLSIFFIYWLVHPLLSQVLESEQAAHATKALLEASESRIRAIVDHIAEGVVTIGENGKILTINNKIEEIFGYSSVELVNQSIKKLMPAHLHRAHEEGMQRYLQTHETRIIGKQVEVIGLRKNGEQFPLELSITDLRHNYELIFVGIMRDISERKAMEISLAESEKRFHSAFDHAAIGVALVAPNGNWLKVNHALCHITGYAEQELLATNYQSITYPEDLDQDVNHASQLLKGELVTYQMEKRYYHKKGHLIWILLSVSLLRDDENKPLYFIAQIQDINKQKKAEATLKFQAYHDPLTGLANRTQLEQGLTRAIATAKRNQQMLAVLFIDLDYFKPINDKYGHDVGDLLLQQIAERLQKTFRASDIIARLGGDEFIIVLTDVKELEHIVIPVEKFMSVISMPFKIKNHELSISGSMGISVYPGDGNDNENLIKKADLALYQAKKVGRNNYQFFTADATTKARQKVDYEKALQYALIQGEFELYYQPKFSINNTLVTGMEALLRWHSAKYGDVSPHQIIPMAEETGLIIPLGEWIIKTVGLQLKIWNEMQMSAIPIAINIAAPQFKENHFFEKIQQTLEYMNINPERIEFELPEALLMQQPDKYLLLLNQLKNLGIRITIDNYGASYSSIMSLQQLPIDSIKINRDLIAKIAVNSDYYKIVTAIIAMARTLQIKTIAVGVESQQQLHLLQQSECDEVQGYYLSHPLSPNDASHFLSRSARFT